MVPIIPSNLSIVTPKMGEESTPLNPAAPSEGDGNKSSGSGSGCCSGFCTFLGVLLAAFFIFVGYYYRDGCIGSPKLPELLMVSGGVTLVVCLLKLCTTCGCTGSVGDYDAPCSFPKIVKHLTGLVQLAQFAIFVFICFLVYKLYPHVNYQEPKNYHYCSEVLFLSVFGSLGLTLIMTLVTVFAFLFGLC